MHSLVSKVGKSIDKVCNGSKTTHHRLIRLRSFGLTVGVRVVGLEFLERIATYSYAMVTLVLISMWRGFPSVKYSVSIHNTQAAPYDHAHWFCFSVRRSREGSLDCMQAHSGPLPLSVQFRKDLSMMNGMPQTNQKCPSLLGIEHAPPNHQSEPLMIGLVMSVKRVSD